MDFFAPSRFGPMFPTLRLPLLRFARAVSAASHTENGAPAFKTSGAACLDLFFQVVPDIDRAPCIKKDEA